MKLKKLHSFKCKLIRRCKKILQLITTLRFRLTKKPVFIRALKFKRRKINERSSSKTTGRGVRRVSDMLSKVLSSLRRSRDIDKVTELKSFSEAEHMNRAPYPSPITPASVRMCGVMMAQREVIAVRDADGEDACRSFKKYLIDMIVEEGKIVDLVDVEEFLYCWEGLKSQVFVDLVSQFYGELCRDLFSSASENM